jgi:hypothetical protein
MEAAKALEMVASEALKPVSGVINALIGPKLERMKVQAKKRELKERLQDKVIQDLLEQYFKRLLQRVSGIKTIVFPEQILPLTSIYEPLRLKMTPAKNFKLGNDQKIITLGATDLEPGQNYLIVDSAGMGKSTFAKHLVLDIFHSTIKIPLFLELRRIDHSETLLGRLSKDIDEDQDDIDDKFLKMLLTQGEYVIILDGYDELTDSARSTIGPQIAELAIKYDQNTLVLTSRPEVIIPDISRSIVYSIQPLEKEQAESLVLRYDAFANLSVGKGLISQFDNVSEEFLKTPLLLVLLYRTYGYNQSIATSVTSFYDDVYNAFYKGHDLTKSGFSRTKLSELDSENFRRLLRGFCFLLLTLTKYSLKNRTEGHTLIEKAITLTSINPSSIPAFLDDLLVSVPFLINDGNEFRFIHKSIAEFFAAEYLAFAPNAEKTIKIVRASQLSVTFSKPFDFLAGLNPSLFRGLIVGPVAKSFLAKKNSIKDPVIRSLIFFGITHIGFSQEQEKVNFRSGYTIGIASTEGIIKVILAGEVNTLPSEVLRILANEIPTEEESSEEFSKESFEELIRIDKLIPLTGKAFQKIQNNPIVRHAINILLSQFGTLNEAACKKVLKVIQEERKAQNQIDAIISGS